MEETQRHIVQSKHEGKAEPIKSHALEWITHHRSEPWKDTLSFKEALKREEWKTTETQVLSVDTRCLRQEKEYAPHLKSGS